MAGCGVEAEVLVEFDTAHCGAVHDVQLDHFGHCLATASADGHVRLWDVRKPEAPSFVADLGDHAGPVYQVCWAYPLQGVLLASAGADGRLIIWGRRLKPGEWGLVHSQDLARHGAMLAVEWAPAERGAVLACASADGTVTVVSHTGAVETGEDTVEHRWATHPFQAHRGQASAVAWASPRSEPGEHVGLDGARLATAGDDGVRVWSWDSANSRWDPETVETPEGPQVAVRDVVWKIWDGVCEMIAAAAGQHVIIWQQDPADSEEGAKVTWKVTGFMELGEEVWKLSFTEQGGVILASIGEEEQQSILLKQRLDGCWDAVPIEEEESN